MPETVKCTAIPDEEINRLRESNAELLAALKGLSDMYVYAWDRVDGGLVMMDSGVMKFEAAHKKASTALKKYSS